MTQMGQTYWLPPTDWKRLLGFSGLWSTLSCLPSDFGSPFMTSPFAEVSWIVLVSQAIFSKAVERYLQAAKALLHASTLDPADPELHIRLVGIRKLCKS